MEKIRYAYDKTADDVINLCNHVIKVSGNITKVEDINGELEFTTQPTIYERDNRDLWDLQRKI